MSRKKTEQEKAQALLAAIQDNDIEGWSDTGFDECDHSWQADGPAHITADGWCWSLANCELCDERCIYWCAPGYSKQLPVWNNDNRNIFPARPEGDQHV